MPKSELSILSQKQLNILEFVKHEIVIKASGRKRYIDNRRKVVGDEIELMTGSNGTRFYIAQMIDIFGNKSIRIISQMTSGVETGILIEDKNAKDLIYGLFEYAKRATSDNDTLK